MFTQCFHGYQQSVPMSENVTTDTNSLWPCQTMLLWIPTTVCGHVRQCYHGYQQSVAMSENVTMDINSLCPCQRMLPWIPTVYDHDNDHLKLGRQLRSCPKPWLSCFLSW